MANSVTMKAQIHARSMGPRALFLVGDPIGELRELGLVGQPQAGEDGAAGVARREHGRRHDVPGRAADAQTAGQRERPVERVLPERHQEGGDREVADERQHPRRRRTRMLASNPAHDIADGVHDEPARQQDRDARGGHGRGIGDEQAHRDRDGAARPRRTLAGGRRTPEAVPHLRAARRR